MSIEGVEHHATGDRAPLRNARSTGACPMSAAFNNGVADAGGSSTSVSS